MAHNELLTDGSRVATHRAKRAVTRKTESAEQQTTRVVKRRSRWDAGWRLAVLRLAVLAAGLALWQYASGRWVREVLISNPERVASKLWGWIEDGSIWGHLWATSQAVILGFLLGALAGVVAGYVMGSWSGLDRVFAPFITALYTLPRLALAPLFILWFGLGLQFKVVFASVIVFFLVFFTTKQGVEEVPKELVNSVRIMGGTRRDVAIRVVLPSALIWVATGLKISVPYALVGVVVGEMLVGDTGLGYLLARSANQFDPAGLFATIVVLLALAIFMDSLLDRVSRRFLKWKTTRGVS